MSNAIAEWYAHLARCAQCRDQPYSICTIGAVLTPHVPSPNDWRTPAASRSSETASP